MIKGVLLDLGGVVFVGDEALPGAIEAIGKIRDRGLGLRFVTNTTQQPLRRLLEKLRGLGVDAAADEIFMPAVAARNYLAARKRTPYLLVHPDLVEDFEEPSGDIDTVVIGDAGESFTFANLNNAFRHIDAGAAFLALATNRVFKDRDGEMSLDAGPFVAALEFATRTKAVVLGKPSPDFFAAAVRSLGCEAGETVMVGDDVESDVGGAIDAGLGGLLVKTGKYREGDETKIDARPVPVIDDLAAAVDWIIARAEE